MLFLPFLICIHSVFLCPLASGLGPEKTPHRCCFQSAPRVAAVGLLSYGPVSILDGLGILHPHPKAAVNSEQGMLITLPGNQVLYRWHVLSFRSSVLQCLGPGKNFRSEMVWLLPQCRNIASFSPLAEALFQLFQWKWHMIAFKKFV